MKEQTGARKKEAPFLVEADLRDYFAAKAIQGMLGNTKGSFGTAYEAANLNLARASYAIADAMLKAREGE